MSQKFVDGLKHDTNFTVTENGAVALKSTHSSLVDLFGQIGALRKRSDSDIESMFSKAFAEDKLLATKMAFYARDIRFGGLGERRVFRVIMNFLAKLYPDVAKKNIEYIPVFGRFDDLYEFVGTEIEPVMWELIRKQWNEDMQNTRANKPVSLLAKWLKSVNTSSDKSNELGRLTARKLGLSEPKYRKSLALMRKHINVVESKMSGNNWDKIDYSAVPSRAMAIYRNAFKNHDEAGFKKFIEKVQKGEAKINASTLFPYDILEKMCTSGGWSRGFGISNVKHDVVLEEQWKALPNYVDGENNILIMADTSGSMCGRPMATSVGLAIYFAERNHGVFHNKFMTFSSKPSFVEIKGGTLYEKVKCVPEIVENTDLEAAFKLILATAVTHNLSAEDMPKSLVVISDMQFDQATYSGGYYGYGKPNTMTFYDKMVQMYADKGYEMPNIIFWQVDARRDSFQATSEYKGVQLASGQSASTFKSILKNIGKNPYEAMVDTLSNPAYDGITV